jgi:hypothetical protein
MKILFLKENHLLNLKENITENYSHYFNSTNNWINDEFYNESPFGEFKIEVPDFELFTDSDKPEETDSKNIRRLYSAMKHLTETQASDERLWSGLAHGQLWNYLQYRWHSGERRSTPQNIKSRFFFAQNKRRSLFVNTLSRLWWIGKLVYDENRSDPFELLEFFKTDFSTKSLILFSNNYTSNPIVTRALLRVFKDYQEQGFTIPRSIWHETMKYVNVVGGAYILDYFTEDELAEKIKIKAKSLMSEDSKFTNDAHQEYEEVLQLRLITNKANDCPICKNILIDKMCRIALYSNKTTKSGNIDSVVQYCSLCKKHYTKFNPLKELNQKSSPLYIKTMAGLN